jgi:hypothetical protein
MIQEAEHVLEKEELWLEELHIRQHVAHQGVPAHVDRVNQMKPKSNATLLRSGHTWGHPVAVDR